MTKRNSDNTDTRELLARIDERTKNLTEDVKKISKQLENDYVTKDQFFPIQKIVYGLVGLILVAFVAALIKMVIGG